MSGTIIFVAWKLINFDVIRPLVLRDGRGIRPVSRETDLSRNPIKSYVQTASPPSCQRQIRPLRHKLNGFETRLQAWYDLDRKRPRRQRRTTLQRYERLVVPLGALLANALPGSE